MSMYYILIVVVFASLDFVTCTKYNIYEGIVTETDIKERYYPICEPDTADLKENVKIVCDKLYEYTPLETLAEPYSLTDVHSKSGCENTYVMIKTIKGDTPIPAYIGICRRNPREEDALCITRTGNQRNVMVYERRPYSLGMVGMIYVCEAKKTAVEIYPYVSPSKTPKRKDKEASSSSRFNPYKQ